MCVCVCVCVLSCFVSFSVDFELVTNGSYGPGESEAMIGYGLFADTG